MKYYLQVLKKYAVFTGRASRMEFWMFVLFNLLMSILLIILDNILGTTLPNNTLYGADVTTTMMVRGGYITNLYSLAVLIPSMAVSVRRLHDSNKTGKILLGFFLLMIPVFCGMLFSALGGLAWLATLMFLVFLAYAIWLLVLYCTAGTVGPNKYGDDPYGGGFKFSFEEEETTPTEE